MRVIFHPEFSTDIRRIEAEYSQVSEDWARRFRNEVFEVLDAIKFAPTTRVTNSIPTAYQQHIP
jgi:hypothetical protein